MADVNNDNAEAPNNDDNDADGLTFIPLVTLMSQDDPRRMLLTQEERQWAVNIRSTIEMMPDIDNPSDYWYAQLALVCKGDVNGAVRRLIGLQDFRREYKIMDDFDCIDAATKAIDRGVLKAVPGMYLAYLFSPDDGTYCISIDLTKFDTSSLRKSDRKLGTFMAGLYFMHHAFTADLETVRRGTVGLLECEGICWSHKPDMKIMSMVGAQLISHYPIQTIMKHFHTGVIFNSLAGILKRTLPKEDAARFQVGCQLDARLDSICLVPTLEAAAERLLEHLAEGLRRRHQNEKDFSLD